MRNLLKAASIINFINVAVCCLMIILLGPFLWPVESFMEPFLTVIVLFGVFIFITGLVYLNYSQLDISDLYQRRNLILGLGIITLLLNFVSGILLLIARDKIVVQYHLGSDKEKRMKISPEIEKIDILLKVGVTLVSLAGLIFATSNWTVTSTITKVVIVLLMGILFISLSIFSHKKLQLKQTELMYWTLGVTFILIAGIASGIGKIFGDWFSFTGAGQDLLLASLSLIASLFSYLTYKYFHNKIYLSIAVIGIVVALGFILAYANISFTNIVSILSLLVILANVVFQHQKDIRNVVERFNIIFLSSLSGLLIIYYLISNVSSIASAFLATTLLIVSLVYLNNKAEKYTLLVPVICLGLISSTIMGIDLNYPGTVIASLLYTIFYIFMILSGYLYRNKKVELGITIILNLLLLLTFLIDFPIYPFKNILVGFLLLVPVIINSSFMKNKSLIEYYLVPIKLIIFTSSLVYLFTSFAYVSCLFNICMCYFVMLFGYFIATDKSLKLEYFILFGLLLITAVTNIGGDSETIPTLVVLLSSFFPLIIINNTNEKKYQDFSVASFIFMLIAIYHILTAGNLLGTLQPVSSLIVILIYLLIMFKQKHKKLYFIITAVGLIFPFYNYIVGPLCDYPFSSIALSILIFYTVYLFSENLFKNNFVKKIIWLVTLSLILISLIFEANLIIGLFVGVVTFLLMIFGTLSNENNSFFIIGFSFLILNLIVQLRDLWLKIPLWIYLLTVGLFIIGVVMYKEIAKKGNIPLK